MKLRKNQNEIIKEGENEDDSSIKSQSVLKINE